MLELRINDRERRWHTDVFVELDRTFKPSKNIDKFERYDHMLAGWSRHKDRYNKHCPTRRLSSSSAATRQTPRSSAAPPTQSSPPPTPTAASSRPSGRTRPVSSGKEAEGVASGCAQVSASVRWLQLWAGPDGSGPGNGDRWRADRRQGGPRTVKSRDVV